MKAETLKRNARKAATKAGHTLGTFKRGTAHGYYRAVCTRCGGDTVVREGLIQIHEGNGRCRKVDAAAFVAEHVTECDISYRGGNLKVDVRGLFPYLGSDAVIGAYQNYLGGGIAGKIVGAAMFFPEQLRDDRDRELFEDLTAACVAYFHSANNGGGDEYMQENYSDLEFNQNLPVSAY